MTPNRAARAGLLIGLATLASTLVACSSGAMPTAEPSGAPSASESPGLSLPSPSPTPTEIRGAATAHVSSRTLIDDGLDLPWDIAWAPDETMLVTLRDKAQILWYQSGGSTTLEGKGADWLLANVDNAGEGGLLGIAQSPTDPFVIYVYATTQSSNEVFRMNRYGKFLSEPTIIVTGIPKNTYHDGGRIRFGPDGYLYVTTGDAGNRPLAQDLNSLAGKILRVVANGTDADGSAAPGNPFGTLVWTYGHRNPQGLGWAPDGRMFAAELGQNTLDELNLIEPGLNYGWPEKEAIIGAPAGTLPGQTVEGYTYPLAWWTTAEASPSGIAVTDEAVYVAALRGSRIWRVPLTPDGVGTSHVLLDGLGRIRLVTEAPNGNLYILTSNTTGLGKGVGVDKILSLVIVEDEE